jgi:hypothetical protein
LENPSLNLHCDPLSVSTSFRNMTSPSIGDTQYVVIYICYFEDAPLPNCFRNCNELSPVRFSNDRGNSQIAVSVKYKLFKLFISREILGNFLRLEHPSSEKYLRDSIMRQLGRIRSLVQLLSDNTSSLSRHPTVS